MSWPSINLRTASNLSLSIPSCLALSDTAAATLLSISINFFTLRMPGRSVCCDYVNRNHVRHYLSTNHSLTQQDEFYIAT